jgi:DNA adenine methylase
MTNTKNCPNCRRTCYFMAPICQECGWDFTQDKLPRLRDDRLRSPYPFFGTKKKVASDLWRLFGDVQRYVEPFLGSAAMILARPNYQRIHCVVNDKNRYVSNFWRAVQHHTEEVAKWCDWPVSEADLHARHTWLESQPFEEAIAGTPSGEEILKRQRKLVDGLQQDPLWCDPKIAGWWAWGQSCWVGKGWCNGKGCPPRPDCRQVEVNGCGGVLAKRFHGRPRRLLRYFRNLKAELSEVVVCCCDWTSVLTRCVLGDEGEPCAIFLDPPYKDFGRCYGRYHDNLVSARVRAWAVENGTNKRLRIILCGYDSEHEMPDDWSVYCWDHPKGMSKNGENVGRERVWCSPAIRPLDRLEALVRVK